MYKPLSLKRLFKIEKDLAKSNFVDFSAEGQHPNKKFVHQNFIHASINEGDRKDKQGDKKTKVKLVSFFWPLILCSRDLTFFKCPPLLDIFQDVWDCSGDNHERSKPGERKNYI